MSPTEPFEASGTPVSAEAVGAPSAVRHDPHHARRWLALGVILIAQVMILLDATIVNVALPSAQADLGFSGASRQWVVTAFLLAFGSLLPLGGRLADALGRKNMFIVGLIGFAIASAVGGAAPNIATLIIARAVQGGFAAVLAPAALSLITVIFTDLKELNRAFAIFGAVAGSSSAIGLLLGGLLTDYASWRWTMYVTSPSRSWGSSAPSRCCTTPSTPASPSSPCRARSSARRGSSAWSSARPRPRPTAGARRSR